MRPGEVEKRRLSHDGGDYGERDGRPPSCRRGAGLRGALPPRDGRERRGRDPPALVRPARLDLDGRAEPPDRPDEPRRRLSAARRSRGCSRAAGSSSTGRTRPACSRSSSGRSSGRRWRTAAAAGTGRVGRTHPHLADEILAEIRERGPLASRHFEGAAGGGMWNWKPAKAMLERLWNHGDLVIAGRQGFQRVYDLAERVIPRAQLDAPVPSEHERLRTLAEQAVRARGVLTDAGVKEHWRLKGGVARVRPAIDELVAEGRLRRLRVDDGGADVLVAADAELDRPAPRTAVLLSPVRQPALGPSLRAPDPRLRPPDRGLQAGAAAAVRLLRPPVPPRRPDRRPRRPEVGAAGGAPRRPRLPPRGRRSRRRARSTTPSTRPSTGSPARSGSRRCVR